MYYTTKKHKCQETIQNSDRINENRAYEVVKFHKGYVFGEPSNPYRNKLSPRELLSVFRRGASHALFESRGKLCPIRKAHLVGHLLHRELRISKQPPGKTDAFLDHRLMQGQPHALFENAVQIVGMIAKGIGNLSVAQLAVIVLLHV